MVNATRRNRRMSGTRKARLPRHAATLQYINYWHKSLFEKLGWMILADAQGYDGKIAEYKKSIDHFLETAAHLTSEYENHNRKHDINVMITNVKILKAHVAKDF